MADLVLREATVVLPGGPAEADVVIAGETIAGIEDPGAGRAAQAIDCRGLLLLPGGVDPHVHLMVGFMGQRSVYDFETGGIAALRGGTTSIVDFALQRRGGGILDGFRHRRRQADPRATVDFGLHQIVTDVTPDTLAELAALRAEGVASLKVYTVYEEDGLKLGDGALHALMQGAAAADLMLVLHAENAGIVERLRAEAVGAGHTHPRWHALTRPPVTELEAIQRAILFSEDTGCGVHILHLVAARGAAMVAEARRRGLKVTAETCTHYLALTDAAYERPDGIDFIISPPLRSEENRAALWAALADGALSVVTSDEVSWSASAKASGAASFATVANGCPGVEARLPVLYTLGVAQGRLSLARFAEVWAELPARIFGLGERKGRVAPGMDADLVAIDPGTRRTMTADSHYGDIGYNVYAGMELVGWPVLTLLRGQVVVRDGVFHGSRGQGRYLARANPDLPEAP